MCICVFRKIKLIKEQRVVVSSANLDKGRQTSLKRWHLSRGWNDVALRRDEHPGIGTIGVKVLRWDLDFWVVGKQQRGPWGWNTVSKRENEMRSQSRQGQVPWAHLGHGMKGPDLILGKMGSHWTAPSRRVSFIIWRVLKNHSGCCFENRP